MDRGLNIVNLHKRFGDVVALNGVSLTVPQGALIGFLGPNGSGKTTTMRAVMGMVRPDAGSISWNGADITEAVRRRIGYMPQERGLYARMRAREQIVYFGQLAGLDRSEAGRRAGQWLERLDLGDRADSLVQELSGGNQQRVQLAVSLVHDPELLILDEPFAGLDPVAAETMREIISERTQKGASVLFSSHQLDLVSNLTSDAVIVANGSVVASGSIDELRSRSPVRRLRIRWKEPVAAWTPLAGSLSEFDGRSATVEMAADADAAAGIAHALRAGPIDDLSMEPPELSELFSDLVNGGGGS
ncbi:MAG: ATP-binding cassette domain-containing protein [Acidimicrobiales bacterium]|nr:ATP-binding cassette domain-containing protein [Acidimicrobiales bacterium]